MIKISKLIISTIIIIFYLINSYAEENTKLKIGLLIPISGKNYELGQSIIKAALGPSIFGALLLGAVYLGFVYLGSHYKHLATALPGELILPAIANHLLGKNGALFIAIIIIFSCLTTAVALNSIYAKYLCSFIGGPSFDVAMQVFHQCPCRVHCVSSRPITHV